MLLKNLSILPYKDLMSYNQIPALKEQHSNQILLNVILKTHSFFTLPAELKTYVGLILKPKNQGE